MKIAIPSHVSGRRVGVRGVHLQPSAYHTKWMEDHAYWIDLLVSMGMSWVVLINDGDSVLQPNTDHCPLKVLLDAGIIPIIREGGTLFPRSFEDHDTFLRTVELYDRYGLNPLWIIRNEPFDDREWANRKVPKDAWNIIMRVWSEAAQFIATNGGIVGFPDGPCYDFNPFESIKEYGLKWIFDQGLGFYAGHHYGKGRPLDYPTDPVSRLGIQLSMVDYETALDDYANDPDWNEGPGVLAMMNAQRADPEWMAPGLTAIDDDTCWRGWEKIAHWSQQSFGYVVPMAMTEGGWVPRDRAGSGNNIDIRWPYTTPNEVAVKTLEMFETPSPLFAICPWLLADEDMGGSGWPFDAWHGWAHSERYGSKKPVIGVLQDHLPDDPPPEPPPPPVDPPPGDIEAALVLLFSSNELYEQAEMLREGADTLAEQARQQQAEAIALLFEMAEG